VGEEWNAKIKGIVGYYKQTVDKKMNDVYKKKMCKK